MKFCFRMGRKPSHIECFYTFTSSFFYLRPVCEVMCSLFSPGGEQSLLQWRNYASAYRSKHTEPISWGSTREVDMEIRTHRSQRSPMAAYSLCGNSSGKCSLPTPGPGLHRADSIAAGVCSAGVCVSKTQSSIAARLWGLFHRSAVGQGDTDQRFFKVLGDLFQKCTPWWATDSFSKLFLFF